MVAKVVKPDNTEVHAWDIQNWMMEGIDDSKELRRAYNNFVDDVHDMWVFIWRSTEHPYETGEYEAHIKKKTVPKGMKIKSFLKHGMPIGVVYNDSDIAKLIEYGTGPDNDESESPFGPNTPTPEFAPMRKTAAQFHNADTKWRL